MTMSIPSSKSSDAHGLPLETEAKPTKKPVARRSELKMFTVKAGDSIASFVALGLEPGIIEVLKGMGITTFTASQSAMIRQYLKELGNAEPGSPPCMRDFRITTGPKTGELLAHAIVNVDYLVKHRKHLAKPDLAAMRLDDETANPETAGNRAPSPSGIEVLVMYPMEEEVHKAYKLYKALAQPFDITVAHLMYDGWSKQMYENIRNIRGCRPSIVIYSMWYIINQGVGDMYTEEILGPDDEVYLEDACDDDDDDPCERTDSKFLGTIKTIVIEDTCDYSHEYSRRAHDSFYMFEREVLLLVGPECRFILVAQHTDVIMPNLLRLANRGQGIWIDRTELQDIEEVLEIERETLDYIGIDWMTLEENSSVDMEAMAVLSLEADI